MTPSFETLAEAGRAAGLCAVAVCGAEPFAEVESTLAERKRAGLHAGMQFTYRNPGRSTDPSRLVPGAASLIVGALEFDSDGGAPPSDGQPYARVAAYARADHYEALRAGLESMAAPLRSHGWRAVVSADENSMVDRAAAHRAAIGWWGKNSNILVPGIGSLVVLGAVVTDAPLAPSDPQPVPDACGGCRQCLDSCPTGAIVAPGKVDARRCLAWLLQRDGVFDPDYRVALGDRIYGCDDCSDVCPPNRARVRMVRRRRTAQASAETPDQGPPMARGAQDHTPGPHEPLLDPATARTDHAGDTPRHTPGPHEPLLDPATARTDHAGDTPRHTPGPHEPLLDPATARTDHAGDAPRHLPKTQRLGRSERVPPDARSASTVELLAAQRLGRSERVPSDARSASTVELLAAQRLGRSERVPPETRGVWLSVLAMLESSDEELMSALGRWYIPRRQPRYLRRNALVVLANTGDPDDPRVRAAVDQALSHPDRIVRAHAVWCARRLGLSLQALVSRDDPLVQAELRRTVSTRAA